MKYCEKCGCGCVCTCEDIPAPAMDLNAPVCRVCGTSYAPMTSATGVVYRKRCSCKVKRKTDE